MKNERVVGIDVTIRQTCADRLIPALRALRYDTSPIDPATWLQNRPAGFVLLAIPQQSPSQVENLRASAPVAIIIGISDRTATAPLYRSYVRAGLTGFVGTDMPLGDLRAALVASLRGMWALPASTMRAVVLLSDNLPRGIHLSSQDQQILNLITKGLSPAAIAAFTGYSERHLRRITNDLLKRIGATNRAHAAAIATRWGLGADSTPRDPHASEAD
jgi:DNA-binding NarL/FixJ family response regulator